MKKWTPTLAALFTLALTGVGADDAESTLTVEQESRKKIALECLDIFQTGQELLKSGKTAEAHLCFLKVLDMDPEHRQALEAVGFRHGPTGEIIPVPERLLANGWNMNRKNRWKPDPKFDHANFKAVSKKVRKEVRSLAKRLGREKDSAGLRKDISSLQGYLAEVGPTALPELTRLYHKGQTRRERTFALATLAPMKPIHLMGEVAVRYADEKDDAIAATQAALLAKTLPGGKIPSVMADRLEKGSDHQALRVSQLAALMNQKDLRPRILSRWRKISSQMITQPGGARNVISTVEQRAYIRDLTAVVNVGIGLFDPDLGYIQGGSVLDVRVVKVEIFRTILEQLAGDGDPEISPDEMKEINKEVFGRP